MTDDPTHFPDVPFLTVLVCSRTFLAHPCSAKSYTWNILELVNLSMHPDLQPTISGFVRALLLHPHHIDDTTYCHVPIFV